MKLISLQLCNFRQFYGKTIEIKFSSDPYNTTIIHGNNGSGKTTIINALTWVLYEQFTAAFAAPDLLVNKRAITEVQLGVSIECWVELNFEHNNKLYQIKRKCYAYRDKDDKIQYSQSQLFMLVAGDDGRWLPPIEQPIDIIERILPKSLHEYFFFDGEHIDHIFREQDNNQIAEDTKELLGVKVLDRAIEHLKKAKKTLQNELKVIGDIQTNILLKQQNKLEEESDRLQKKQLDINNKITEEEQKKQSISQRLLELSGAEELQQLKQKIEAEEKTIRKKLVEANQQIKKVVSSRAYIVFLPEINHKFTKIVNELRERGEIPSGIKKHFVQQLIQHQICLCGRELEAGTAPYQRVKSWLNKAGMAEVEEAVIRLESQVNEIEQQAEIFWQEIDQHQDNINQWRKELAERENQADEIKHKLRKYPNENIQQLQHNLDTVEYEIKELILEQGANKQTIDNLNLQISDLDKKIYKHQLKENKQTLAQERIQITEEAIARLIEVRSRLERQFRLSLEKRVQEIFSDISFTPYIPRLNNNYQLTLIENTSGIAVPVAASTGENQILSLSLIGGIIDRVREWSQKNTLMGPDTSTLPIVMDSPYGSLDEIYRRQVAKCLPKLANQLVVLVTKTQWRGEVETEMKNYIGKQYVLTYNSPKPDCEEDIIQINGVSYPLVRKSNNEFEYTEIQEL